MEVYHYVYHLIDPVTGQFYYGSRTCKGITPQEDVKYKGSMKSWKPEDKNRLVKTILKEFPTRKEADLYEGELQKQFINDPLNENYYIQTVGFSTLGLPSHNKKEQDTYIDEVTKVHNGFFTYPRTVYIDSKTKIIVTCPIHDDFSTNPGSHLKGHGCPHCAGNSKKEQDLYIEQATKAHDGYYTYPNINYIGNKYNILVCCPKHGDFPTNPKHHLNGVGCPDCHFDRITGEGHSKSRKIINVFTKEISTINQTAKKLRINSGSLSDRLNNNKPNSSGYLFLNDYSKMTEDDIFKYMEYVTNFSPRRKGKSYKDNTEWCDKISKATKGGNNPRAKKVVNTQTNIIYGCIKDAAESFGINNRTLGDFLNGKSNKKTYPFKYFID